MTIIRVRRSAKLLGESQGNGSGLWYTRKITNVAQCNGNKRKEKHWRIIPLAINPRNMDICHPFLALISPFPKGKSHPNLRPWTGRSNLSNSEDFPNFSEWMSRSVFPVAERRIAPRWTRSQFLFHPIWQQIAGGERSSDAFSPPSVFLSLELLSTIQAFADALMASYYSKRERLANNNGILLPKSWPPSLSHFANVWPDDQTHIFPPSEQTICQE